MGKFIKEPLVHFLLLGLAIFIIYGIINDGEEITGESIVIDDNDIERLIKNYQNTWNEYPDEKTIRDLVDTYIRSEVLYAEALQLNLDHNDEIVKRRLMQKYEFLIEDLASNIEIDESELRQYWEEHQEKYKTNKRLSFTHHYFNPDLTDDAEALALKNLNLITDGKIKSHSSHLDNEYENLDLAQIANTFGQEFSSQISELSEGNWYGPIKSGYGYHLVNISFIVTPKVRGFDEVKELVSKDYQEQYVAQQQEQLYDALKEKFEVDYRLKKYKDLF